MASMKEPEGCCSKFGRTMKQEFQVDKLPLSHYPADDFYKSQWQRGSRSLWWLLYRWCAAGFFIGVTVSSAVEYFGGGKFFIYLTDWGIILCMVTTTYGAVLATMWYFRPAIRVDPLEENMTVKVYWALHWSTLVLAVVITLMFWSFLYPQMPGNAGNVYNIMQHACNSVVMLIDHMLVAFPSRLLHFVYPLGIGIVYILFSLVYYFSGGTDPMGNDYIYPILDWGSAPGWASLTAVGAIAACFILSFILFWLYKFRRFCYKECYNAPKPHAIGV